MAEKAVVGASSTLNGIANSTTYYGPFGAEGALGGNTSEAAVQLRVGVNATAKNLRVQVNQNNRSVPIPIVVRVNGADSALGVTIPASTTGTFADTTNTASLSSSDLWNYALATGSGTGTAVRVCSAAVELEATDATVQQASLGSFSTTVARVMGFSGHLQNSSNTALVALSALETATLSNLQIVVTANGGTGFTAQSQINGVAGAQSISVGAGATGRFEDTTNTDSVGAGDTYHVSTSAPGGSVTFTVAAVRYTSATANRSPVATAANTTTLTAGTSRYSALWGRSFASAVEADAQCAMPFAGTLSHLSVRVRTNASTIGGTLALRKNGVTSNVSVAIPASSTGVFQDLTHTETFDAGDLLCTAASGTDGNLDVSWIQALVTAAAPVQARGSLLLLGVG